MTAKGIPRRLTSLDLAAQAIADARQQVTGVAEAIEDLAGIITMILEVFANCGGGGQGIPPRPLSDDEFIKSVRNPDATGERVYQQAAWREAERRVPRQRGQHRREIKRARRREYSIVYWSGKDALTDASDSQLLAMRDDIEARS